MEEINIEQLEQLKKEGKKILLDFYGVWCSPCRVLMPKLQEIKNNYDNIIFAKMDVDQNKEYAMSLGIRSVPTVMIFNGEKLVDRSSGVNDDSYYKNILNSL